MVAITLSCCERDSTVTGGAGGGSITPAGYVDLGLPSGTTWKAANEVNPNDENDFYTYGEAVAAFGNQLPTQAQFDELLSLCTYTWDADRKGANFTSTVNGKSIFLPAAGYRNYHGGVNDVGSYGGYWSSTHRGEDIACYLYFSGGDVNTFTPASRSSGHSVRLVQN